MWASMKPGTTMPPPASITRAPEPAAARRASDVEPTNPMRSPYATTAPAHGSRGIPVQTRALTIARVGAAG
jgi:hypothetical protein